MMRKALALPNVSDDDRACIEIALMYALHKPTEPVDVHSIALCMTQLRLALARNKKRPTSDTDKMVVGLTCSLSLFTGEKVAQAYIFTLREI